VSEYCHNRAAKILLTLFPQNLFWRKPGNA
jgi:hypothetical protein